MEKMTINVDNGKIDKECELNRSYGCCGCAHYYDESDAVCKLGCIHYVKNNYDIYIKEKMESKFKLGDVFTKKYTRDTIPIEIYEISYNEIEPVYKLKPIRLSGDDVILGEEALIKLYNKIN